MKKRTAASLAGWAAHAAVVVGAALAMRPDEQIAPPVGPAKPTSPVSAAPAAPFPPPPAAAAVETPLDAAQHLAPAVEEGRRALCDGCLAERAVLDVVEAYLRHLDPAYLQGGIWAQPLAEVAPATPGQVHGLPKLAPGLLGAPEYNPMGMTVDTRDYPVETTWLVWIQTGWRSPQAIEQRISSGDLPEVARAWPPVKKEVFVAVDGRTGELRPDGIFHRTSIGIRPEPPPHHGRALELARERADDWLRKARQARSP